MDQIRAVASNRIIASINIVWTGSNDAEVIVACGSTLTQECWHDGPAFQVITPGEEAAVWTGGYWKTVYPGDRIYTEPGDVLRRVERPRVRP